MCNHFLESDKKILYILPLFIHLGRSTGSLKRQNSNAMKRPKAETSKVMETLKVIDTPKAMEPVIPKIMQTPKAMTVEVCTMEGVERMNIKKPQTPLSAEDKPDVIVKTGDNEYVAGILLYIGTLDGKEVAGIQMSTRQLSEFEMLTQWACGNSFTHDHINLGPTGSRRTGSNFSTMYSDGRYKDGKRYFKW